MAAKCKISVTLTEHFIRIYKNKHVANKEYKDGHRCERTYMTAKCKIFVIAA